MLSWFDDNTIVGFEKDVLNVKQNLMNQFDCEDCGPMDEYVGCTIQKLETGEIKFLQKLLVQSFSGKIDIGNIRKVNTLPMPGTVFKKQIEVMCFYCKKIRCCTDLVWGRQCT